MSGMGLTDSVPTGRELQETSDSGTISVEVFGYSPAAEKIARDNINFLREMFAPRAARRDHMN